MTKSELVFIPIPGLSHLVSTVEAAKLLLDHDDRLSITVLIVNDAAVDTYTHKVSSSLDSSSRLKFINLPKTEDPSASKTKALPFDGINNYFTHIRDAVSNLVNQSSEDDSQLVGLVLDMFCTKFAQVGDEFGIPSYIFFTSGACALGVIQYLRLRYQQNQDLTTYKDSNEELSIQCFSIPVPTKLLSSVSTEGGTMNDTFLNWSKEIAGMKGIMVNTFYELEPFAIESLLSNDKVPKVYPVGPILNLGGGEQSGGSFDEVRKWLDEQPESSVVFLCFGTMGAFEEDQVKEFAMALENSGHHFLWSLRKSGPKGTMQMAIEYEDFDEVLPEGFLERTNGIGKVIGWAPQVEVLSHPAVGGFVSHCGWNSILESVWFGVPIATFPMYAEQHVNAFELVKELGMAEMITLDYNKDMKRESEPKIVGAEEIEAAIRRLMTEEGSGVREKVKEMKNKARSALLEGGSSYNAQRLFIEDVIKKQ